ncbi:outer membrane protein OmpK [uncultured Aquitalea sp.]|uniref:outer membrane protein OmpK n=1 Tax=uncultured Aquitalea sp. TaxID=540272 RepID=UPI0025F9F178|nr:outer membrane protein OmpK [uncultured Aquitalea sp.]
MKARNLLLALSMMGSAAFAHADNWSWGDVSANYLDWSSRTTGQSGKKDFAYLELEGGMGGQWGELYGFFDLENPGKSGNGQEGHDQRYTTKAIARFNMTRIGDVPVQLYAHVYDTRGNEFFTQNRVLGLGTDLKFGNLTIKPFIGAHNELDAFGVNSGFNGWMAGYVLLYPFSAFGQSFLVSQWHETEFARKDKFTPNYNSHTGQNGAIALWWNVSKHFTTGVQYRYADQKLGTSVYQNAMIYSAKYNF